MSEMLRVEEGAGLIRVSRSKMFELIKSGEIRSVKIGRSRRIPASALDEYVARLLDEQAKVAA